MVVKVGIPDGLNERWVYFDGVERVWASLRTRRDVYDGNAGVHEFYLMPQPQVIDGVPSEPDGPDMDGFVRVLNISFGETKPVINVAAEVSSVYLLNESGRTVDHL